MPTSAELRALIKELRNARTRLLPIEVAERIQHAIVRLEQLSAARPDAASDDASAVRAARELLAECKQLLGGER
ncbi:MAG: hypothetical protein JWM53_1950 [bacterium]|nr:hypothetical protein [bacterium]